MTKPDDLAAYVFDGKPHLLSSELAHWMEASPRFITFAETYRDKIRKKIRVIREPESMLDLRSELQVACCLLNDRRLSVEYEPYASAKRRSPDFAVTYRGSQRFNIEVARMHMDESAAGGIDLPRKETHILRILLNKMGQAQPGMPNLLVIQTREDLAQSIDLDRLLQEVKTRVEGKDPVFLAAGRLASPAEFYKDFLRLNAIVLWAAGAQLWVNKQARPRLPDPILRLVRSLLFGLEQMPDE